VLYLTLQTPMKQLRRHPIPRLLGGFRAFFRGFIFIRQHRLWPYVVLPSLLSLVLGILLLVGIFMGVSWLGSELSEDVPRNWIQVYQALSTVLAAAIALFVAIFSYQLLASVLVIPFLGPLLSQVEKILTGESIDVSLAHDLRNALFGIWGAIRDLVVQLVCLLISLFTGPFQPAVMATITGHFLGRASFDFILEKHTKTLQERRAKVLGLLPEIEGLGIAQFLVLLIPILGVLVGPSSSLVGAALLFYPEQPVEQNLIADKS
jgi:CysZ protein